MKVYALPAEVPYEPNYANFDLKVETRREVEHMKALAEHLKKLGYIGANTGRILRIGHADGHAAYMFAESKKKSALIHLPYGDAWDSPHAAYMPKAVVLKQLESISTQSDLLLKD